MNKPVALVVGALLIAVLVLFNTTYSIAFHEVGVKTRFGRVIDVVDDAGLHWKIPFFVDRVAKLDKRLQLLNSSEDAVATRDTQQVIVQAFVLWRVSETPQAIQAFHERFGTVAEGSKTLQAQLQSALRSGIGKFGFDELIGEGANLKTAEEAILAELRKNNMPGVELAAVGISQLVLPAKTTVAVLRRMEAEQRRRANAERDAGSAEAEGVRSQAIAAADKIRAFAQERASQIRAQGDKEAAQFYQTMKEGEPLAKFLAWLRALEASLSSNTTIVLDATREPFHLVDPNAPLGPDGIPIPANSWINDAPSTEPAQAQPAADISARSTQEASHG
jgi:modulator of FtsH protease HflC